MKEPTLDGLVWYRQAGMFYRPLSYWTTDRGTFAQYLADPTLGRYTLRGRHAYYDWILQYGPSRNGPWLDVPSTHGRPGYLRARDARLDLYRAWQGLCHGYWLQVVRRSGGRACHKWAPCK